MWPPLGCCVLRALSQTHASGPQLTAAPGKPEPTSLKHRAHSCLLSLAENGRVERFQPSKELCFKWLNSLISICPLQSKTTQLVSRLSDEQMERPDNSLQTFHEINTKECGHMYFFFYYGQTRSCTQECDEIKADHEQLPERFIILGNSLSSSDGCLMTEIT